MSERANASMDVPPTPTERATAHDLRGQPEGAGSGPSGGHPNPSPGPDVPNTGDRIAPAAPLPGADAATSAEPVSAPEPGGQTTTAAVTDVAPGGLHGGAADLSSDSEVELECPQCGLVLVGDSPRATAEWFCPRCDFPVFWASPPPPDVPAQPRARRRLPGTAGTDVLGAEPCWKCGEMNGPDSGACVRCIAPLPQPVEHIREVEVVVQTPIPVPFLYTTASWPFVVAALLAGIAIGAVAVLWATWQLELPVGPESVGGPGGLSLLGYLRGLR